MPRGHEPVRQDEERAVDFDEAALDRIRLKRPSIAFVAVVGSFLFISAFILGHRIYLEMSPTDPGKVTSVNEFVVVGDFGRGDSDQARVASAMGLHVAKTASSFVVGTGDNIYPAGVTSDHDTQFQTKFENMYSSKSLLDRRWFMTLGNHDYYNGCPDCEVRYSNLSKNQRWYMPDRYYYELLDIESSPGDQALFVFVDTYPIAHPDAAYIDKPQVQLEWIKDVLKTHSDARWKVLFGHHPCYTYGAHYHPPQESYYLRTQLRELLNQNNVHAFVAGHDHDLQHIHVPDDFFHQFVSGAGSETRPLKEPNGEHSLYGSPIQGFLNIKIGSNNMEFTFIGTNLESLYQYSLQHPDPKLQ